MLCSSCPRKIYLKSHLTFDIVWLRHIHMPTWDDIINSSPFSEKKPDIDGKENLFPKIQWNHFIFLDFWSSGGRIWMGKIYQKSINKT